MASDRETNRMEGVPDGYGKVSRQELLDEYGEISRQEPTDEYGKKSRQEPTDEYGKISRQELSAGRKTKSTGETADSSSSSAVSCGCLYLCATPIGNLEDITLRVLRILKEVDLIAAEDTRNSLRLLNHFGIRTPLTSYHEYNRIEKAHTLIAKMRQGQSIALVTDAGTPGISDPGEDLVRLCYEAGIEVISLPGACACVTALTLSGLPTRRFCFEAFLPQDKKEKQPILEELKTETRTTVIYEAPHRLVRTLKELYEALGDRRITVCRELTKKYETVFQTTLSAAIANYEAQEPRGECVIVMEGRSRRELRQEEQQSWAELDIQEHVALYEQQGMTRKDAMKQAAKDRGISKREVYGMLLG